MKLRVGVLLWLLSWVPYGWILGLNGWRLTVAWTVAILLGLVGLALAGSAFAALVKQSGWRGAPRVAWRALVTGDSGSGPGARGRAADGPPPGASPTKGAGP